MKKLLYSMDSSGDTRIAFDPDVDQEATAEAKALFERVINAGGQAFKVKQPDGKPDEKVTDFAQLGEETVLVPRVVGG
jgi:hypothetical protein